MFNHARTLLVNLTSGQALPNVAGYELIPPTFMPLRLSGPLLSLRQRLFGASPDQLMLNFRTYQILTLLHALPCADYLFQLDGRVTYKLAGRSPLYDAFGLFVDKKLDNNIDLIVDDRKTDKSDASGRTTRVWTLNVSGTTSDFGTLTFNGNTSNDIQLPGAGLKYRINRYGDTVGKWRIEQRVRPEKTLVDLVGPDSGIDAAVIAALFQPTAAVSEPYTTFSNMWHEHPETPYQIAGLLLAYIYRLNELLRK